MIQNRIKKMDIKITELANYLQISRPTMYKFIEYYDNNQKQLINHNVRKLFDYIIENEMLDKRNVINYIFSNIATIKEMESEEELSIIKTIRKYIISNPKSEKTQFLEMVCSKTYFDLAIHYFMEIAPLLKKKKFTIQEKDLLKPYYEIISIYTKEKEE